MATYRIEIQDGLYPDPSNAAVGPVFWELSIVKDTNDRYPHEVLCFNDTATDDAANVVFTVPKNYVSGAKFVVVWRTTASTGNAVWAVTYAALASGSMDVAADAEANVGSGAAGALAGTTTAGIQFRTETAVTPQVPGNFLADKQVFLKLLRKGTSGLDTLAAAAVVEKVFFEYADV